MDEAILVQEVDAGHSLDEEVECSLFRETAFFFNEDEQVALGYVFHDEVNVLLIFQVRVHAHDVYVFEFFVDVDLAAQGLAHLGRLNHALVELFNGHFHASGLVLGQMDLPVAAFAELAAFKL